MKLIKLLRCRVMYICFVLNKVIVVQVLITYVSFIKNKRHLTILHPNIMHLVFACLTKSIQINKYIQQYTQCNYYSPFSFPICYFYQLYHIFFLSPTTQTHIIFRYNIRKNISKHILYYIILHLNTIYDEWCSQKNHYRFHMLLRPKFRVTES